MVSLKAERIKSTATIEAWAGSGVATSKVVELSPEVADINFTTFFTEFEG